MLWERNCKIMSKLILFQGDSITDAGRAKDDSLSPNEGLGSGYPFMVMSRLRAEFPLQYDVYNKGISGHRVVDLYARWKKDCLNLKPDVLSILIGVNDTWHEFAQANGVEVPRYERIYREMLQWTVDTLPGIKLILMEPFVLPFGAVDPADKWQAEIDARRAVVEKLAKEFGAVFFRTQDLFNEALKKAPQEYWLKDGVHPTSAGHALMADAWIKAAKDLL